MPIQIKQVTRSIKVNQNKREVKVNRITRDIQVHQVGRRGPQGIQGEQGPQGTPGSDATDKNFVQEFTNSSTVTVTHSLSKYPAVTVTDSTGDEVEGDIEHLSINQLVARFSSSFTGRIVCN